MKKITTLLFLVALSVISFKSFTYSSGPNGGLTNAPGEGNCTSCHSSASLNSGSFSSALKLSGNFTGNGYLPDSTYTIKIEYAQPGISKFGFNVTSLDANDDPIGDFTRTNNRTQKRTKTVSGSTRQYMEHTNSGTSATSTNKTDWTFEWKAPSSNVGDVKFYVSLNAANGNNGTSGDTIYAKVFTVSPSSLLPTAQIVTNDTNICQGSVASFSVGGTGSPTSYEWTFTGGSPSQSTAKDPKVNYNNAGTFYARLRVKNSLGQSNWDTAVIKVNRGPSAFIQGGNRTVCPGDSIMISVPNVSGNTYLWSDKQTGNAIWVKDPGKYYVIVTDKNGCSRVSNEITVSHLAKPTASLTTSAQNDSICSNGTLELTSTQGLDSFVWYRGGAIIGTGDTNVFNFKVDTTAEFFVRAQNSNGCWSDPSDTAFVEVVQRVKAPVVKCASKTPFSVTFEWDPVDQFNGYQVSTNGTVWDFPSSGRYNHTHRVSGVSPNSDVTLYVRALDLAPCYYGPTTMQVCKSGTCDSLEVVIDYPKEVCKGDSATIEVKGLSNEKYAMYFEGGSAFTDTIFSFTPTLSRTYQLQVQDSSVLGCPPANYALDIQVDEISQLRFRTQKPLNEFCSYDSVRFSATAGNDEYRFYVNNNVRKVTSDSFYYESLFNDSDSAFVIVQKGACVDTSETITINVVPDPDAGFTYNRSGSEYSFIPNGQFHQKYFWEFGDGFTSVLQEPTHDYASSGGKTVTVDLEVTDNSNCVSKGSQQIDLPDFTGVAELGTLGIRVYPNPANGVFTISDEIASRALCYTLSDIGSRAITSGCLENGNAVISVEDLTQGLYILGITDSNGDTVNVKIAVE